MKTVMIPAWSSFRWNGLKAPCGTFLKKRKLYILNYNCPSLDMYCGKTEVVAALYHRGDCIYLMHINVKYARSLLCKVCMFGSSFREESHLEGLESQLCSKYKLPRARQDERFYINYCSNTTFVESVISKPVYL